MFSHLGMGEITFDAIVGNDYNLALVSLLSNLLADVCYAWLDPRIAYQGARLG